MKYQKLFKAIDYMAKMHNGKIRKSNGLPQSVHLYGVATILLKHGFDDDLVIAGLLHDAIEDTDSNANEIRELFGEKILAYVLSETEIDKKNSWKLRKETQIKHFKNASYKTKVLAAADKIHNLITVVNEYNEKGDVIFDVFKASKEETLWYYQTVIDTICFGVEGPIFDELKEVAKEIEKMY